MRHINSLIIGHYSMLCSVLVGILLFVITKVIEMVRENNMGHKEMYTDAGYWMRRLVTYVVVELCGVLGFALASIWLNQLDFIWSSAILAGAYAIAIDGVLRTIALGGRGIGVLLGVMIVSGLIFILAFRGRGDHLQICVLIKVFTLVETCISGCNVGVGILKSAKKENI